MKNCIDNGHEVSSENEIVDLSASTAYKLISIRLVGICYDSLMGFLSLIILLDVYVNVPLSFPDALQPSMVWCTS
jgi:hypothetical protein